MLNKGDTCYVRLNDGKIRKAKYIESSTVSKCHRVTVESLKQNYLLAQEKEPCADHSCRIVCMSGMRKEYVEAIK